MKYEIRFSPTARAEILEAFDYIRTDQHAPLNAARWLDGIIEAVSNLADYPEAHALARENDEFDIELRQIIFKSHRIVFDVADKTVRIHRVVHVARRDIDDDAMIE
jgi:plasmid stabilization system protein ParE